jgi:type II secretory pathway pseudopilin PulG
MKFFSKPELISVILIFLVLVAVSWPNFSLSMRRARDQIRRDDIGNIQSAIDEYYADYGIFPASTTDGKMVVCKGSSEAQVPCDWGRDTWINLTPGVNKVYMKVLPGDPKLSDGTSYYYSSDGSRYQLFGSLEGVDEPEYDAKLAARGVKCGDKVCNIGRANNVPLYITVEEYGLQILCSQHPKDPKCLNRKVTE